MNPALRNMLPIAALAALGVFAASLLFWSTARADVSGISADETSFESGGEIEISVELDSENDDEPVTVSVDGDGATLTLESCEPDDCTVEDEDEQTTEVEGGQETLTFSLTAECDSDTTLTVTAEQAGSEDEIEVECLAEGSTSDDQSLDTTSDDDGAGTPTVGADDDAADSAGGIMNADSTPTTNQAGSLLTPTQTVTAQSQQSGQSSGQASESNPSASGTPALPPRAPVVQAPSTGDGGLAAQSAGGLGIESPLMPILVLCVLGAATAGGAAAVARRRS